MSSKNIAQKIWNYCDTLRDDGLGYNDYLEQLTYLLFLKMADENSNKYNLPEVCNWKSLITNRGGQLLDQYEKVLKSLAESGGMLEKIFAGAQNKIHDSTKLNRLLLLINEDNWSSTESDVKGEIYETLLQKNAENSGAGQYFTPRPVIQAMVACIRPTAQETIADPSCGTGGFFLGALNYLENNYDLSEQDKEFLKFNTFHGWEIEKATARLCLMNLYLHGIGDLKKTPDIQVSDSLNPQKIGKQVPKVKIVLANPPFGKSSSDIPTTDKNLSEKEGYFLREDFWVTTSNKQLAFLQHIVSMLEENGRAAVVLPDNVLFEGGAGELIRKSLLEKVNLHTILRLPTGIFYAQGVKSNVLFFDKVDSSKVIATDEIWYYDYRTNINHTPKKNPLTYESLKDFVNKYNSEDIRNRNETFSNKNKDGRWRKFTYDEIISRDKINLDITWLKDDSEMDLDNLPDPEDILNGIIENLGNTLVNLNALKESLN
ncbi:SAM-dependent DNA methyltransferase [Flavobacterium sp. MR2016-29]|uniref:type I restriction-modification system subunit M n=1 Tax=Flavobacterium sp. MR2016-29 TaxID=2783795 RepID=UPI00188D00A6|nr:class I SAM-dependent DNA methyltransferase [Flavobacterium sp. MR2016-29]MBF4491485.1 SAM-dependent DNA methyltransferase [Flavobacterium sp. MR2016-29]